MATKNTIKQLRSLHQKKFRMLNKSFIAEGEKIVGEILQSKRVKKIEIFALQQWIDENKEALPLNTSVEAISNVELHSISMLQSPNKVLAVLSTDEFDAQVQCETKGIHLVLDGIKDPGNLGTIIRLADWYGFENLVCSENTVELFNPKTIQATMGSFLRVNVSYTNLYHYLSDARNTKTVYGTFLDGNSIYSSQWDKDAVVVIGSESHGISKEIESLIQNKIHIPSFAHHRNIDSLNASIATAIICSEIRRSNG